MSFFFITFSFISIFFCLQLLIVSPIINVQNNILFNVYLKFAA